LKIRWNIRRKLNAVLTLCGLLFIVICAPIISYLSFAEYEQNAMSQQGRLVGAVRTSAAIATYVANEEIAEEVLNGLLQDDEILAVAIEGEDGFSKQANSQGLDLAHVRSDTMQRYMLFSPVNDQEIIGEINVWPNTTLIRERAAQIVINDIVLLVFLTLLLAITSMFATNVLVGKPLRRLADQVSSARPGEDSPIEVERRHARDEIGLVTASVNGFLSVTNDALEKERELRLQVEKLNRHYSNIFSTSHVGIMVIDEQGLLLHHNPVLMERIIKLDEAQRAELSHSDIFSIAFSEPEDSWNLVDMARTSKETVDGDLQLKAAWHQPCWVHCILNVNHDMMTDEEVIEVVMFDVTKRINEAEAVRQLAELDPLTGLHNRRGCENYLKPRLRRLGARTQLVVMLLDLDGFKPVNDQYGHKAGDQVLQCIAERLQAEVRSNTDLVGRVGGDEFIVFLKMKADRREMIEQVANKIIARVSAPISVEGDQSVRIGVSIGIAKAADYENLDALMRAADEAMYRVKTRGKNSFAFAE